MELGAAAQSACERWQVEAEAAGRRLACSGGDDALAAASEEDVATLLDNLVENALLYSPPDTEIEIDWGVRGEHAFLAVLDRGPGVGDDDPEQLFERFARGSAARSGVPGTGLGLAIVRTLARRWGGDARLLDRPGGGTRAEVTLPVAVPTPSAVRASEVPVA